MGLFRVVRKAFLRFVLAVTVIFLIIVVVSQVQQYIFRSRAELLLSQIQSLELRNTSWQQARVQLKRWGSEQAFGESCDAVPCFFQVTLNDFVLGFEERRNLFEKLDDYFRWRLRLSYNEGPFVWLEQYLFTAYIRLGGHPAKVIATVGTRDGVVWSKAFHAEVAAYGHPAGWSGTFRDVFPLIASVESSSRLDRNNFLTDPQLTLHPQYAVGPSNCTICVKGWAHFTPYAAPEDVRRLMALDLSCLGTWHHCFTQQDIMPLAWKQYLDERSFLDGSTGKPSCSPSFPEVIGRDSESIAVVEIQSFHDNIDGQGYHSPTAEARLLMWLKGATEWKAGETRNVAIRYNSRESLDVQPGTKLLLFRPQILREDTWIVTVPPCPIVFLATESILNLVKTGIAQDYSAKEN